MSSKIEEVASALREAVWSTPEGKSIPFREMSFILARAAIKAMREPTSGMKEAGFDAVLGSVGAMPDGPIEVQSDAGSYAWRAMVDEALREDAA